MNACIKIKNVYIHKWMLLKKYIYLHFKINKSMHKLFFYGLNKHK